MTAQSTEEFPGMKQGTYITASLGWQTQMALLSQSTMACRGMSWGHLHLLNTIGSLVPASPTGDHAGTGARRTSPPAQRARCVCGCCSMHALERRYACRRPFIPLGAARARSSCGAFLPSPPLPFPIVLAARARDRLLMTAADDDADL